MKRRVLFSSAILMFLVACPFAPEPVVSDAEVGLLRPEQKKGVDAAAKAKEEADLEVSVQRVALRAAVRQVEIAELLVARTEAEAGVAKLWVQAVTADDGQKLKVAAAHVAQQRAEALLQRTKANLEFREEAEDYHAARVELAEAELSVTSTKLELAKYTAVADAKAPPPPEAANIKAELGQRIAADELAVAEVKTDVARAKTAMRAALATVQEHGGPLDGSPGGPSLATATPKVAPPAKPEAEAGAKAKKAPATKPEKTPKAKAKTKSKRPK